MKTIDLGEKRQDMPMMGGKTVIAMGGESPTTPEGEKESKMDYPRVYIGDRDGITDLKVGDEVMLKAKVCSVTERETDKGETYSCDLDILSMEMPDMKSGKNKKTTSYDDEDAIEAGLEKDNEEK
jgi:hypothetical protein